jgi:molecular chaperone GrpE
LTDGPGRPTVFPETTMFRGHKDNNADLPEREDGLGDGDSLDSPEAVERLQSAFEAMKSENSDLLGKYQRSLADFQNYQRRALANEREAGDQATRAVAQSILPALDHSDLALAQDPSKVTAEQMFKGVEAIRAELLKALSAFGVTRIEPARNDPFDPTRHSAVTHQASPGVQPGRVVSTLQAGYTLGDRVVRPAMVAVATADDQ